MSESTAARFWGKVDKSDPDGCWPWTGAIGSHGYGVFQGGRGIGAQLAHRVAYEDAFGEIPAGLQIDHLCRLRPCVRPTHMEAVTARENLVRGNGAAGRNSRKTHCPQGHAYSAANTYRAPSAPGTRRCRACMRARNRKLFHSPSSG